MKRENKELRRIIQDNPNLTVRFLCMIDDVEDGYIYEFGITNIRIGKILITDDRIFEDKDDLREYIENEVYEKMMETDDDFSIEEEIDKRMEGLSKYWETAILVHLGVV